MNDLKIQNRVLSYHRSKKPPEVRIFSRPENNNPLP